MKIKNNLHNTNYLLLGLFVVISIVIYYLNIQTIKSFRQEIRAQATFLVQKYTDIISSSDELDLDAKGLDFMHEVMLPSLKVPIILENYQGIMDIILPTLGKERQKTYSPFLPICPKTGDVLEIPVVEIDQKNLKILFDNKGEKIEKSILSGGCKLQWKVDWAMR